MRGGEGRGKGLLQGFWVFYKGFNRGWGCGFFYTRGFSVLSDEVGASLSSFPFFSHCEYIYISHTPPPPQNNSPSSHRQLDLKHINKFFYLASS